MVNLNMTDTLPLVRKLQAEAASPDASVTNLLRMAKIAAMKLRATDALVWIDQELNGYMKVKVEDLPPYRQLIGIPKGYHPHYGWQPIQFQNATTEKAFSLAPISMALGAIEKTVNENERQSLPSLSSRGEGWDLCKKAYGPA
jgi:hypothetical protein